MRSAEPSRRFVRVCSPLELAILRQILPASVQLVTPGIRAQTDASGDQKRTLSAAEALKAGANWKSEADDVNAGNGNIWKRTGRSKVVGQETVTTRAGTFETFKIETTVLRRPTNDPTRKMEITVQTWYAPSIDHWVKRTFVSRGNGNLLANNTVELVEYGRKQ